MVSIFPCHKIDHIHLHYKPTLNQYVKISYAIRCQTEPTWYLCLKMFL